MSTTSQHGTNKMPAQCLTTDAGQHPFNPGQCFRQALPVVLNPGVMYFFCCNKLLCRVYFSAVFEPLSIFVTVVVRSLAFLNSGITVDLHTILSELDKGLMARERRCNIINVNREDVLDGSREVLAEKPSTRRSPLMSSSRKSKVNYKLYLKNVI